MKRYFGYLTSNSFNTDYTLEYLKNTSIDIARFCELTEVEYRSNDYFQAQLIQLTTGKSMYAVQSIPGVRPFIDLAEAVTTLAPLALKGDQALKDKRDAFIHALVILHDYEEDNAKALGLLAEYMKDLTLLHKRQNYAEYLYHYEKV